MHGETTGTDNSRVGELPGEHTRHVSQTEGQP